MALTEQELENSVYRKKSIGTPVTNYRNITTSELNECNTTISNLMSYILSKHS